jgi:hypothetical protein
MGTAMALGAATRQGFREQRAQVALDEVARPFLVLLKHLLIQVSALPWEQASGIVGNCAAAGAGINRVWLRTPVCMVQLDAMRMEPPLVRN